jgi:hypothetical protein
VLRGLAEAGGETVLHRTDGSLLRCTLGRVGADFVETSPPGETGRAVDVMPFASLAAVRSA